MMAAFLGYFSRGRSAYLAFSPCAILTRYTVPVAACNSCLAKVRTSGAGLKLHLSSGNSCAIFDDLVADFIPAIGQELRHSARNRRGAAVLSKRPHDQGKKHKPLGDAPQHF